MAGNFFKGTSLDQDSRWKDKDELKLKDIVFPTSFNVYVNLEKVDLGVINPWIDR